MNLHAVMWWGVGRTLLAGLTRATTSIKIYGAERIPREGGAVLAVNHIHWIDIPVIGATCPRRISYLAKAEVDAVPLAGAFIRSFGTLFVRRGESDRDAVRLAREAVRHNLLLGMFVEGTRQRDGRPGEAKPGAAMVAIQEGVPVVPASIYGTERWRVGLPRTKVGLAWGEPMRFSEYPRNSKGYRKATEEIEAEIRRLWEFLQRMDEAGWPEGVPPRRAAVPSKVA